MSFQHLLFPLLSLITRPEVWCCRLQCSNGSPISVFCTLCRVERARTSGPPWLGRINVSLDILRILKIIYRSGNNSNRLKTGCKKLCYVSISFCPLTRIIKCWGEATLCKFQPQDSHHKFWLKITEQSLSMTSEIVFIYLHSVVWNPFVLVCVGQHGPGHGFFVILILRLPAPLSKPLLPKIVLPQEAIFDFGNIKVVKQFANFHIPGYNMITFKYTQQVKNVEKTRSTFKSNTMKKNSYQHKQQYYDYSIYYWYCKEN